jgi:hypothetical protein
MDAAMYDQASFLICYYPVTQPFYLNTFKGVEALVVFKSYGKYHTSILAGTFALQSS